NVEPAPRLPVLAGCDVVSIECEPRQLKPRNQFISKLRGVAPRIGDKTLSKSRRAGEEGKQCPASSRRRIDAKFAATTHGSRRRSTNARARRARAGGLLPQPRLSPSDRDQRR